MRKQILFRKCFKRDGKYFSNNYNFEYPKEGWIEASDWNPKPECGGGLHALRPSDALIQLEGNCWQTFTDYEDLVIIDNGKVKVRQAYVISDADVSKYKNEFLKDPAWACYYAEYVDRKTSKRTRDVACKDPLWALHYALKVDREPSEQTRNAACKEPCWAFYYALEIDKKPSRQIKKATSKSPYWETRYTEFVMTKILSLLDEVEDEKRNNNL